MSRLFPLILAGCTASVPMPRQQPPPINTTLEVDRLESGQPVAITVLGVPAGSVVRLGVTREGVGPGPCPGAFDICFGILDAINLGQQTTTGTSASWTVQVPPGFDGNVLYFQALVDSPIAELATGIVQATVGDRDGDWVIDGQDNCLSIANPVQWDGDGDGFGEACDCHDGNASIYPGSPFEVPGDGIDHDCSGADLPTYNWPSLYVGEFERTTTDRRSGNTDVIDGDTHFVQASTDGRILGGGSFGTGTFGISFTFEARWDSRSPSVPCSVGDTTYGTYDHCTITLSGVQPNRTMHLVATHTDYAAGDDVELDVVLTEY